MTPEIRVRLDETLRRFAAEFPKSTPVEPSAFAAGIVQQLRDLAELIENGTLTITHFSLTVHSDSRQRLEIEVN